jgi:hypothetical protein
MTIIKFLIIHSLILSTVFAGGLTWSETEQVLKVVTTTGKKTSSFTYTNSSDKDITFIKIKASCGCVLVDAPQVVKAGETGTLNFKAPIPRAGGTYGKSISVDTDEAGGIDYTLRFRVTNTDKPKIIPNAFRAKQITSDKASPLRKHSYRVPQGYTRPNDINKRALLVEKLMANQALSKKNLYSKQIDCPFLPLPISLKLFHDYNGLRIYTCCEQCLVRVKESPSHAIIKLAEKGQTPMSEPKAKNVTPANN